MGQQGMQQQQQSMQAMQQQQGMMGGQQGYGQQGQVGGQYGGQQGQQMQQQAGQKPQQEGPTKPVLTPVQAYTPDPSQTNNGQSFLQIREDLRQQIEVILYNSNGSGWSYGKDVTTQMQG